MAIERSGAVIERGVVEVEVLDSTAAGLDSVNKSLGAAKREIENFGDASKAATDKAGTGLKELADKAKVLPSLGEQFASASSGLSNLNKVAGRLPAIAQNVGTALKAAAAGAKDLKKGSKEAEAAAHDLTKGLVATGLAIAGMMGPPGMAVAAVGGLTLALYEYSTAAAKARDEARRLRIEQEITTRTALYLAAEHQKVEKKEKKIEDLEFEREKLVIQGRRNEASETEREIMRQKVALAAEEAEYWRSANPNANAAPAEMQAAIRTAERELELFDLRRDADAVKPVERARSTGPSSSSADREKKRLEDEAKAREEINKLIADAVALTSERARQEEAAAGRVIELAQFRRQREEQDFEQATAMRLAGARTEMQRVEILGEAETRRHQLRLRQIEEEHRASSNALAQREIEIRSTVADSPLARLQQEDALKQVVHEREVERLDYELEKKRAKDAEEVRMFEAARARQQQQLVDIQTGIGTFEQLYSQASEFASFAMQQSADRQEAELERTVLALKSKGLAQRSAIDREIKAAQGNVALQNDIRRRGARQEEALQLRIEKANADHQERQRKSEARAAGWKLMIDGAVNFAKAITSYASLNIPQGLAYTAAGIFNVAQGGMLLAGNIPGAGGGGGGGSDATGGGGGGGDRETSAASSIPGSTPGEASRRSTSAVGQAAQQQGGTTVIINGGVHANGAIDDEFAERMAFKLKDVGHSREGAKA